MDIPTGNNEAKKLTFAFFNQKAKQVIYTAQFLNSPAYKELKPSSRKLYEGFMLRIEWVTIRNTRKKGKKYEWIMKNQNKIIFPYSEMLQFTGYKSRATIATSIRQLVENGFIDVEHSGQAYQRNDYSIYGISERWKYYGHIFFIKKTIQKDIRKGESLRKYQKERKEILKKNLLKIAKYEANSLKGDIIEIVIKTNSTMKKINSNQKRNIIRRIKNQE